LSAAHSLFNVGKKIARIRSREFLEGKWSKLYNKSNLPIDVIISPEAEVAKSLFRKLEAPGALDNVPFAGDKIKILEIAVGKNCPIMNMPLKNLTEKFPDFKANILGAVRKNKFVFFKKKDQLLEGDKAYVVVSTEQLNQILKAFGHEEKIANKIVIVGGGNIGLNLARLLEKNFEGVRVKIIEKNKERAELIASELSSSIVICGDALDEEILKEANIEEAETILALTNDDEDNIMVCVLAEKYSPA
jgi:trk system potassium uptake protein TrkA